MSRVSGPSRVALAVAAVLAALSLVAWRQSRALETLSTLEQLRRETSLARAERAELLRRARHLESRARVVPAARDRLDMHLPRASEIVYLSGGAP